MELTNFYGKPCDISPYLELYKQGEVAEVTEWLWNDLYHQGDIGTASIAWVIEAHEIFLQLEKLDWNYLGFIYAVMESLEENKFIPCPEWAEEKYRPIAIKTLQHALDFVAEPITVEQQLSILSLTSAITNTYKSFELMEYAWGGYEERLMELDFEKNP
jgi:hypothetical protein